MVAKHSSSLVISAIQITYNTNLSSDVVGLLLTQRFLAPLHVVLVDQSRPLVMDSFGAYWDWGPWLCSALHAGVVGIPFDAGQCGLDEAGDLV